jgi:hypothetical protein
MKKLLFSLILLLVSYVGFSQKGLSYQAVILDPNAIEVPGQDISGQPFVNGDVWMKFSIYNGSALQFEEVQKTRTDAYGLVNLMIGSVSTASFNSLVWDSSQKTLQVYVSFNQGGSYLKVSEQKLTYSPYTLFAETAGKLGGVLGIAGGGTGATTAADARLNLGLDQVNNTSDAAKPVSTATQAALDLKANTADVTTALALKANTTDVTTALALKANTTDVTTALALKANTTDVDAGLALKANTTDMTAALAAKADTGSIKSYVLTQVAEATIADADASTKGKIQLAGDLAGTAAAPTVPGLALKENSANKSTNVTTDAASDTKYPSVKSVKTYVDTQVAGATIADANATSKGKIQLAGDLAGTAAAPTVPGLALKENSANKSTNVSTDGASDSKYPSVKAVKSYVDAQLAAGVASTTIADADASTKGKIQLTGDLGGTAAAPTVPGLALKANATDLVSLTSDVNSNTASITANIAAIDLKAPIASPTFTGTVTTGALSSTSVTAPTFASNPRTLTYTGSTINWNPLQGLNAAITLTANSTLAFTSTPPTGSYGTIVLTQDGTGSRTITLPSITGINNKILGSSSTSTVTLSTIANAKDILNFYYDGTECYWNIGQGYGVAATVASTNLASSVSGTLAVANGGTGVTSISGLVKGNGTSVMSAAVAGTDYLAPNGSAANLVNYPTFNQSTTGNAATVTTNANLTGDVTSVGNIASVVGINGVSLAALTTGILKNTTTTGVASIAVAGTDYQAPITLTTTGSGSATLSGTTLNIPTISTTVNASSISGTVTVLNGGTGQTTIAGIQAILGLAGTKVAIGANAGKTSQGSGAFAMGNGAGETSQGANSVALGYVAGSDRQGASSIAIGVNAAQYTQGSNAVAIGDVAGQISQGAYSVAIGSNSQTALNSVAIGGYSTSSYANSTAIGYKAATTAANTIQLGGDGVVSGSTAITNVKTTGTLTAGTVTYPNAHNSTAGQVLTINSGGTATWSTPASSSGTAHTVGEYFGGGIVFYITAGGLHGLIADTYENGNASNEEALDFVTNPTYHNSTYGGNLYTDWRVPTYYELTLLYAARATPNLNLTTGTYLSCTFNAYSQYKNLKFSDKSIQLENANWVPRTLRAIRSF